MPIIIGWSVSTQPHMQELVSVTFGACSLRTNLPALPSNVDICMLGLRPQDSLSQACTHIGRCKAVLVPLPLL
jgi:hypothetical protein